MWIERDGQKMSWRDADAAFFASSLPAKGWKATTAPVEVPIPAPTYRELRARNYPSVQDQLDMQYWDRVNGTTLWADAIRAVKEKYPKP